MRISTVTRNWSLAMTSGVVVCALALMGFLAVPAYADNSGPTSGAPVAEHQTPGDWLERAYQRELEELGAQQSRLDAANSLAAEVQAWIDKLSGEGVDTTIPAAALSTFQSEIAATQSAYDAASDILTTGAGFDADGLVTDRDLALETVTSARQSLLEAEQTLKQAVEDLQTAIREFRSEQQSTVRQSHSGTDSVNQMRVRRSHSPRTH